MINNCHSHNRFYGYLWIELNCTSYCKPLVDFVCLGVNRPTLENFSLMSRRHHYRRRAANFDLCSAFKAIEQWGFFNVPHQQCVGSNKKAYVTELHTVVLTNMTLGQNEFHLLPFWACTRSIFCANKIFLSFISVLGIYFMILIQFFFL